LAALRHEGSRLGLRSRLEAAVAWPSSGVPPGGRRRSPVWQPGFGGAGVGRAASSVCRGPPVRRS